MNSEKPVPKLFSLIIVLTIIAGSVFLAIPSAGDATRAPQQPPTVEKGEDFTHNVMLELFVTTTCMYCPSSEAVAKQLNGEYGEHFVFVTMVMDDDEHGGNGKARDRSEDYVVGAVPDAVFDGGYRREVGGQDDTSTYEGHIEDSGDRTVPEIDLSVEVADNGDGTMEVSYSATYKEFLPYFDAHLRVYIVERASRWPDKEGHPIPYGFIDYAFDEDVSLPTQVEVTDSTTWTFDDYENATFDNFIVVATLFDNTGGVEGYAVQSATTETTNIVISDIIWDPVEPENSDDMTFRANVTGNVAEVELEYAICTDSSCGAPKTVTMELEEGTVYTAPAGNFGSDAVTIDFRIIGKDAAGNEVKSEMIIVEFGKKSGGSGGDHEEDWVESNPLFYSGVGLIVIGFLAVGIPLMNRKKEEGEEVAFFSMMDEQDSGAYPADSDEESYVDGENLH